MTSGTFMRYYIVMHDIPIAFRAVRAQIQVIFFSSHRPNLFSKKEFGAGKTYQQLKICAFHHQGRLIVLHSSGIGASNSDLDSVVSFSTDETAYIQQYTCNKAKLCVDELYCK